MPIFHVNEFRGFEKFCEGRMVFEMPYITPRICGICPVSHHLASAKAGDAVMGCPPPRPASLLRELMHMGQIVQSHGMHFFELAGPDLLLGFDADPAIRNVRRSDPGQPRSDRQSGRLCANGVSRSSPSSAGNASIPTLPFPVGSIKPLYASERDTILPRSGRIDRDHPDRYRHHPGLGREEHGGYQQICASSPPVTLA